VSSIELVSKRRVSCRRELWGHVIHRSGDIDLNPVTNDGAKRFLTLQIIYELNIRNNHPSFKITAGPD
jgi:hypothetical protein